jgi:hypothetical protein
MENGQAPAAPTQGPAVFGAGNVGITEEEAAESILGRLRKSQEEPEQPEPQAEDDQESPSTEEEATEAPDEGQAEEVDDSVEVEYEGEKLKVPAKIKDALLRQADYTRKTQEVAEHRKAIEAERQAVQFERQMQQVGFAKQAELHNLDSQARAIVQALPELWRTNPGQAAQYQASLYELQSKGQAVYAELQQLNQEYQSKRQQYVTQKHEAAAKYLSERIQGYTPGSSVDVELAKYAERAYDIPTETLSLAILEHPSLAVAFWKAKQFDDLQAKKPAVTKKVTQAPKTLAPGSSASQTSTKKVAIDEADKRLAKTHHIRDASAAILARMRRGK